MNVVSGQEPEGFAIHKVESLSAWVGHRRDVRSWSESNLGQTPVLQIVFPDVSQSVYGTAEQNGFARLGPHDVEQFRGNVAQLNRFMASYVYPVETGLRLRQVGSGEQVIASGKEQNRHD